MSSAWPATEAAPRISVQPAPAIRPRSARSTTSGCNRRDQRGEISVARCGLECLDHSTLQGEVGIRRRCRGTHPAAGATGQLLGRGDRALEDRRDLLERHAEQIMQDEGESFSRPERLEDHQQRKPDRVGDQRPRPQG